MSIRRRGKNKILHGIFWKNGKNVWRSLHTTNKETAKRKYAQEYLIIKGNANGECVSVHWSKFLELYKDYCRVEKSPDTNQKDEFILNLFAIICNVGESKDITPSLLNNYKSLRSGKVTNLTINRQIGLLKNMSRWGQKEGYINKTHDFKTVTKLDYTKKRRVFFELHEVKKIKKVLKQKDLKTKLIVLGGLNTGMRSKELLNLKVKYIDFKQNIINLTALPNWSPKDNEEREVPLFNNLKAVLNKWINNRKLDLNDYIFTHENGRHKNIQFKVSYMNDVFKGVLKEAEIGKGSFYSLRHTFATHMADKVNLGVLRTILGHSNLDTTKIYLHMRKDAIKKAAKKPPF